MRIRPPGQRTNRGNDMPLVFNKLYKHQAEDEQRTITQAGYSESGTSPQPCQSGFRDINTSAYSKT